MAGPFCKAHCPVLSTLGEVQVSRRLSTRQEKDIKENFNYTVLKGRKLSASRPLRDSGWLCGPQPATPEERCCDICLSLFHASPGQVPVFSISTCSVSTITGYMFPFHLPDLPAKLKPYPMYFKCSIYSPVRC